MKILFIGDIVGRPGREAVAKILPDLKTEHGIDFVIANGENLSHGKGMSAQHAHEMREVGIDFFTSGNHIWKKSDIFPVMNQKNPFVIRPANYPQDNPGKGYAIVEGPRMKKILVINLLGRVFVREHTDCPFRTLDRILKETLHENFDVIFVDFHAEATSEKICFGLYAAERVSAVVGTHTHVPTADETLLKEHTAYITDVGYVGLKDSAIGIDPEPIIKQFLSQMPVKHEITGGGPVMFNSVLIEFSAGKATSIERIQKEVAF